MSRLPWGRSCRDWLAPKPLILLDVMLSPPIKTERPPGGLREPYRHPLPGPLPQIRDWDSPTVIYHARAAIDPMCTLVPPAKTQQPQLPGTRPHPTPPTTSLPRSQGQIAPPIDPIGRHPVGHTPASAAPPSASPAAAAPPDIGRRGHHRRTAATHRHSRDAAPDSRRDRRERRGKGHDAGGRRRGPGRPPPPRPP